MKAIVIRLLLLSSLLHSLGCVKGVSHLGEMRENNRCEDLQALNEDLDLSDCPLDLKNILEIAFERNLDLLVQDREQAIQREMEHRDKLRMLPSLTARGELSGRTKNTGHTQKLLSTGVVSSAYVEQEHHYEKWDVTVAFSLLDFGVSYYRARQSVNRSLMLKLQHQRMKQNLAFDIVSTYWQAIATRKTLKEISQLIYELETIIAELERSNASEWELLEHQEVLLRLRIRANDIEENYYAVQSQLRSLMGLPLGTSFELAEVSPLDSDLQVPLIEELETTALVCRPELYSQDIQEKVMSDEVRSATLEMFPNVLFFASLTGDDDSFLLNKNWLTAGSRASWNLLSLPSRYHHRKSAIGREHLAKEARLALSVGVITQVRLAYLQYHEAITNHHLSKKYQKIKGRQVQANRDNLKLLELKEEALDATIKSLESYTNLQIALERVNNSIGKPLLYNSLNYVYPEAEQDEKIMATNEESTTK